MRYFFQCAAIALFAGCIFAQVPRARLATVTVAYVDSFGTAVPGCIVQSFKSFNEDDNTEYERNFEMLVGNNIPFGRTYRVILNCDNGNKPGPFWVSVSRQDQFLLLSSWTHREDYYTGTSPRFTVSISAKFSSEIAKLTWVKVVGLYSRDQEVDIVDPASRSARFYNIQPGKFLVLVLKADRVECIQPIKIIGPNADLRLSLFDHGCKASGLSGAEVN